MKRKNKKFQKKNSNSLNKLSLFQKNDSKFSKKCPLSVKNAPIIDYKNVSLLKNIFQITERLYHQRLPQFHITNRRSLLVKLKKRKY